MTNASPAPGTPQSADKAWKTAVAVLAASAAAEFGFGEAPSPEALKDALLMLWDNLALAGIAGAVAFIVRNKPL